MGFSALVGVVYEGILERVLSTIEVARANVSLSIFTDSKRLDFDFRRGELLLEGDGQEAGSLLDEADALYGGVYTLIKHEGIARNHGHNTRWVLLPTRRRGQLELEQWFHARGYATGVVAHRQELALIIKQLRPEVVLADCPRSEAELTCEDLREHYSEIAGRSVLVVTQSVSTCRMRCKHMHVKMRAACTDELITRSYSPIQLCQLAPFNLDQLGEAMEADVSSWLQTA